jgi:hypothetical protein
MTYSERVALLELTQSYRYDAARPQTFFDYSVVPAAEVTSEQLV